MPYLNAKGDVIELLLGSEGAELDEANPENRFGVDWLDAIESLLSEVADAGKPVVISATGKFFSNGLDTDHIFAHPDDLPAYLDRVHAVYTALLTLPVPTVAAINGHAFGAGAMLALCADYRLMRTERGFWSLPEASLNMPFTRGMASLIRTRIPDAAATEAMYTSCRYGADDAVAAGIVEESVEVGELRARAAEIAAARATVAGPTLTQIKRGLRARLLEDLAAPTPKSLV